VRLDLVSPVPPAAATDVVGREVLAQAVENLQINCQMDGGAGLGACAAAAGDADAAVTFGAGATARVNAGNVGTLRTVSLSLLVRSRTPVREQQGDAQFALDGQSLAPSGPGAEAGGVYIRRAYRMEIAVRNTSLGVL
jgi:Type IV Pilus-assembly protein W